MLIGLSGKMRSGKDTVCVLIKSMEQVLGMPVHRIAFADTLKQEVWDLVFSPLGVYRSFEEYMSENNRLVNRELWQLWGTEVRRKLTAKNLEQTANILCSALNVHIPSPVTARGNYWALGPLAWCRQLLTQLVPEACEDYWIKQVEYKLLAEGYWDRLVVVTDVRFPNEADMIKRLDGFNVRVLRTVPEDLHSQHSSETALDNYEDWDWTLVNEGTFEELSEQVSEMLIQLGKTELEYASTQ